MTPKFLLLALLSLLAALSACVDSNEPEMPYSLSKIASISTYYYDQPQGTVAFHYDLSGRLTNKYYSNSDWTSYSYAPDTVFETIFISRGSYTLIDTLLINNKGFAYSRAYGFVTMEYESLGFLVYRAHQSFTAHSYTFLVENGNNVEITKEYELSGTKTRQTNKFLTNSINTIGNENKGITFLGRQDKELLSTIEYSPDSLLNFTYEYDAKKRVSKYTTSTGVTNVFSYID